jgi:hypothetical protein
MKKFLILFVILDFVFVGIVLKISTEQQRHLASVTQDNGLTEGQTQKLDLMNSFRFSATATEIGLSTDRLQSACASYAVIELKFKALNVAFSGQEPLITHSFSCEEIKKDNSLDSLITKIEDFKSLKNQPALKKEASLLKAQSIYSDEEMPNEWRLFEIRFSGASSFSVSEAEINKILGEDSFKFKLN